MSCELAVSVREVGKSYYIHAQPHDALFRLLYSRVASLRLLPRSLRDHCRDKAARYGRRFDALRDVSFELRRGESVGIIGRNGSGKSTLLQIVAGTLAPTRGSVEVNGRVGALLELGSGFNPEFTGRENMMLNGMILGATPAEMRDRAAEIEAFAEIGDFIDQPVKTYSAGMLLRLAFAVQISLIPDILVVDEALSVGDVFFAQKCTRRIKELQERGTTLLFVSHDMALVRDLCERAIYLRQGTIGFQGPKDTAIALYFQSGSADWPSRAAPAPSGAAADETPWPEVRERACWIGEDSVASDRAARLVAIAAVDAAEQPTLVARLGQQLTFRVLYQSLTPRPVHVTITLKNRYDQVVFAGGSFTHRLQPPPLQPGEYGCFEMKMTCMIEAGQYTFRAALTEPGPRNRGVRLDETPWLGPLSVQWDYEEEAAPFLGMFGLPTAARFRHAGDAV
jgi:lipopolysaccharide transport system ATP-binding protein